MNMKSHVEKNEWVSPAFAGLRVTILCRKNILCYETFIYLCHYTRICDVWLVDSCVIFSLTAISNEHRNIKFWITIYEILSTNYVQNLIYKSAIANMAVMRQFGINRISDKFNVATTVLIRPSIQNNYIQVNNKHILQFIYNCSRKIPIWTQSILRPSTWHTLIRGKTKNVNSCCRFHNMNLYFWLIVKFRIYVDFMRQ
jgi:hypothetical protein